MATQSKPKTVSNTLKDKTLFNFKKQICSNKSNNTSLVLIHSPKLGLHWKAATHPNPAISINPDQPYHITTIKK